MIPTFYEKFVIKADDEGRKAFFAYVNSFNGNRSGSIDYTSVGDGVYTIYAYQDREDENFNKIMKYLQDKELVRKEDFLK